MQDLKKFNYNYLNHLIATNGISLTSLEKHTGVSHSALSLLTRGISTSPHHETVKSLALYFKISVHDFYSTSIDSHNHSHENPSLLIKVVTTLMKKFGIISSSELHRHTGISIPTMDRIINGITTSPNERTLLKLAKFFQISIPQLKGIDPIKETELLSIDKHTLIPLINISNVVEWLNDKNPKYVITDIESNITNPSNDHYAIIYKATLKTITYIFNPHNLVQKGSIVLIKQNELLDVFIYLNDTNFLTLDYVNITINTNYIILGVSVQELHIMR